MAAITAVLSLFQAGDRVIISSNVYGGTFRVLDKVFRNFGLGYEIVDTTDLQLLEDRITPNVKAILVESPANPLLTVTDLAGVAKIAQAHGILSIVDNFDRILLIEYSAIQNNSLNERCVILDLGFITVQLFIIVCRHAGISCNLPLVVGFQRF